MALSCQCKKGHSYVAPDIIIDHPEGAPICPECFAEWKQEHALKPPPLRFSYRASCVPEKPSVKDFTQWLQREFDHEIGWFVQIVQRFPENTLEFTHDETFVGKYGEWVIHLLYSQKCYFASYYSLTHS